jgi:hypothetical protein
MLDWVALCAFSFVTCVSFPNLGLSFFNAFVRLVSLGAYLEWLWLIESYGACRSLRACTRSSTRIFKLKCTNLLRHVSLIADACVIQHPDL